MKVKVTTSHLMRMIREREEECLDYGLCTACGYEQDCVEPDAENYTCESCGENKVSAPEMLLFSIL